MTCFFRLAKESVTQWQSDCALNNIMSNKLDYRTYISWNPTAIESLFKDGMGQGQQNFNRAIRWNSPKPLARIPRAQGTAVGKIRHGTNGSIVSSMYILFTKYLIHATYTNITIHHHHFCPFDHSHRCFHIHLLYSYHNAFTSWLLIVTTLISHIQKLQLKSPQRKLNFHNHVNSY